MRALRPRRALGPADAAWRAPRWPASASTGGSTRLDLDAASSRRAPLRGGAIGCTARCPAASPCADAGRRAWPRRAAGLSSDALAGRRVISARILGPCAPRWPCRRASRPRPRPARGVATASAPRASIAARSSCARLRPLGRIALERLPCTASASGAGTRDPGEGAQRGDGRGEHLLHDGRLDLGGEEPLMGEPLPEDHAHREHVGLRRRAGVRPGRGHALHPLGRRVGEPVVVLRAEGRGDAGEARALTSPARRASPSSPTTMCCGPDLAVEERRIVLVGGGERRRARRARCGAPSAGAAPVRPRRGDQRRQRLALVVLGWRRRISPASLPTPTSASALGCWKPDGDLGVGDERLGDLRLLGEVLVDPDDREQLARGDGVSPVLVASASAAGAPSRTERATHVVPTLIPGCSLSNSYVPTLEAAVPAGFSSVMAAEC